MQNFFLYDEVSQISGLLSNECRRVQGAVLSTAERLILRHKILCRKEGADVGPLETTRIINCSYESVRRVMRKQDDIELDGCRAFFSPGLMSRQIFDLLSRHCRQDGFIFFAPVKRAIASYIVLKGRVTMPVLRREFQISHEGLRLLIDDMIDVGYVRVEKENGRSLIIAEEKLNDVIVQRGRLARTLAAKIDVCQLSYRELCRSIAAGDLRLDA